MVIIASKVFLPLSLPVVWSVDGQNTRELVSQLISDATTQAKEPNLTMEEEEQHEEVEEGEANGLEMIIG